MLSIAITTRQELDYITGISDQDSGIYGSLYCSLKDDNLLSIVEFEVIEVIVESDL